MRIALAMEYPLMQQGGTEVLVRELLRGLHPHHEIVLVSGDEQRQALPAEYARLISGHLPWKLWPVQPSQAVALAASLREQKIQLAHFHLGGTYAWRTNRLSRCPIFHLLRSGVPCLTTNHLVVDWLDCGIEQERPLWYKLLAQTFAWWNRARLYRLLRFEVCVSKHDRECLARMFPMFGQKIIQRYHSLLSADASPPNLLERDPVILCVGTIGGRKAQPLLAEAFALIAKQHPAWRVDFIGRIGMPKDADRIQNCATEHNLTQRLNLLGRLSDEETVSRMKRASIMAMPSLREGLGLSMQEGLFHGCAGLATRVGGIPELVDDGRNGLVVPPGDVQALAAALDKMISNPDLLAKFRAEARPSVMRKGMTAQAMTKNYLDLYEQCRVGR